MSYIMDKCKLLKNVEMELSQASTKEKNFALEKVAEAIDNNREEILRNNQLDIENARKMKISEALIDRLKLDNSRIDGIIEGINTVIKLPDPIWKSDRVWTVENGLSIYKMTVP